MLEQVLSALRRNGYEGRVCRAERLADLRAEYEARRAAGELEPMLDDDYFRHYAFNAADVMPGARSVVVVAAPHPPVAFTFARRGKTYRLLVPPTYFQGAAADEKVAAVLNEMLAPGGGRVVRATLPVKLLAVRTGLAAYGKNNITYVEGLGSFYRLTAFLSDLPVDARDGWREAAALPRCAECVACARACPTGAIADDRFLLHVDRCITFHNEMPPEVPFPRWLEPSWHECLVGCMKCQRACPENKAVRDWFVEGAAFDEAETALLLRGAPLDELPPALREKLERTDLAKGLDVLPRNLGAIFNRDAP